MATVTRNKYRAGELFSNVMRVVEVETITRTPAEIVELGFDNDWLLDGRPTRKGIRGLTIDGLRYFFSRSGDVWVTYHDVARYDG